MDWVCSWGPLILGHADPSVIEAVTEAAPRHHYGAPTAGEVELAAEVTDRFASVEMVRMTSSGTEATMCAIRLARAVDRRERIVKFAGAYHGHVDGLLAEAGSGLATPGDPRQPRRHRGSGLGDRDRPLERLRRRSAGASTTVQPAAIIAEPIPANMGVVPPEPGFLEHLRDATRRGRVRC